MFKDNQKHNISSHLIDVTFIFFNDKKNFSKKKMNKK